MSEPTKLISLENLGTFKDNLDTIDLAPLNTRITNVENDLSSDSATLIGNPLNFTTLSAQKAVSTQLAMKPIQDLHGYDYPWPARGGKNVLPLTVDIIKSVNQSFTWDGNSTTANGITYEILTDDGNNVTGIKVSGTTTAGQNSALYIASGIYIQELLNYVGQTVMCSGCPAGGATDGYHLRFARLDDDTPAVKTDIGNGVFTTITDFSEKNTYVRIYITAGTTCDNLLFTPQIEIGNQKTTFVPYTNICPIDGRTETNLVGCGKNLVEDVIKEYNINASGALTADSRYDLWIGRVVKNTIYTVKSDASVFIGGFFTIKPSPGSTTYDGGRYVLSSYSFTAPITGYVVFRTSHDYATPQIDIGTQSTNYEPYVESNNITLQFGEKVYSGILDVLSGKLTVTMGYVDLGDYHSGGSGTVAANGLISFSNIPNIKNVSATTDVANIVCTKYATAARTGIVTGQISLNTFSNIIVCDTSLAGTALSDLPTIFVGTYLAYELDTPVIYQLSPSQVKLLEGSNTVWTSGDSITLTYRDGKMATLEDVKKVEDKIDSKMPVPTLPSSDGDYILKCTMVSGVPTFSWEMLVSAESTSF